MSRRGQTNARTSSYSRRVPIRSSRVFRSAPDRNDQVRSIDRYRRISSVAVVRESVFLVSCVSAARAATSGSNVFPPRARARGPCSSYSFPPFFPSSLPSSPARRTPRRSSSPLSASYILFFPIPLRTSYSSRLLLVSATRASSPPRRVENLYIPRFSLSRFLSSSLSFALTWISSGT